MGCGAQGANFDSLGAMFGTRDHYYHLMKQHLKKFGEPTLANLFKRWYDPKKPLPQLQDLPCARLALTIRAHVCQQSPVRMRRLVCIAMEVWVTGMERPRADFERSATRGSPSR